MSEKFSFGRFDLRFWENLGFERDAAEKAALCFPEAWEICLHGKTREVMDRMVDIWFGRPWNYDRQKILEEQAARYAEEFACEYKYDPRHPAFWYFQGCDFDEMEHRATTAAGLVQLQREAAPPPPKEDNVTAVMEALLMQEPPVEFDTLQTGQVDHEQPHLLDPTPISTPEPKPFDADAFPRIETKRRKHPRQ